MLKIYKLDDEPLMEGEYGKVLTGIDKKTETRVAIKTVCKKYLNGAKDLIRIKRELKLM